MGVYMSDDKDIMKVFYEIYEKQILPIITPVEETRRLYLKKLLITECLLIIALVLLGICSYILPEYNIVMYLLYGILMITFAVVIVLPFSRMQTFSRRFKQYLICEIIKSFGNITYSKFSNIPDEFIKKSLVVLSEFSSRIDDDCFEGYYKGVLYNVTETTLLKSDNNFAGVLILIKFNKQIRAKTIIVEKEAFGIYDLPLLQTEKEVLEEIKLEDIEFSKHYRAFSEDQVEGRYLVTTAFMERFKELKNIMKSSCARCSFFDNYVLFAIPTVKNRYEIANLFCKLDNPKRYLKFFQELSAIYAIIDYFKLDENTGI